MDSIIGSTGVVLEMNGLQARICQQCEILKRVDEARQWAIGDWLVDGKGHYGDGLYKRAAELTGMDESTLRTFASIAGRFELLSRNNKLAYNHHKEVASVKQIIENEDGTLELSDEPDSEKISELLAEAEKDGAAMRQKQRYAPRDTMMTKTASTFGLILAAILGAILGGWLVAQAASRPTRPELPRVRPVASRRGYLAVYPAPPYGELGCAEWFHAWQLTRDAEDTQRQADLLWLAADRAWAKFVRVVGRTAATGDHNATLASYRAQ